VIIRQFLKPLVMPIARIAAPSIFSRLEQLNDWAQLRVYQAQNQAIGSPSTEEHRVVFFGDSITEFWNLAIAFPGKSYINRGISGQTTPQMLVRFRPDVVALQPKVVLILAGTNDLAGNTGPATLDMITDNYASMAEIARANRIRVVFASVLPVHDYGPITQSTLHPPEKIKRLNQWLKDYCIREHHTYLDYYSALGDERGMLGAAFADDGVHPNSRGYLIMATVAEGILHPG